jgi:hypothetical protein
MGNKRTQRGTVPEGVKEPEGAAMGNKRTQRGTVPEGVKGPDGAALGNKRTLRGFKPWRLRCTYILNIYIYIYIYILYIYIYTATKREHLILRRMRQNELCGMRFWRVVGGCRLEELRFRRLVIRLCSHYIYIFHFNIETARGTRRGRHWKQEDSKSTVPEGVKEPEGAAMGNKRTQKGYRTRGSEGSRRNRLGKREDTKRVKALGYTYILNKYSYVYIYIYTYNISIYICKAARLLLAARLLGCWPARLYP